MLWVGLATSPFTVPGINDPIWLAPAALHGVGGSPVMTGSYAVPNAVWALGIMVAWQGVVVDASGSITASNRPFYVHH